MRGTNFYRHRLDTDVANWPLLQRRYQSIGEVAAGAHFRLGLDALVLEIVRFRTEKGEGVTDAVLAHELHLTRQILADVAPTVIVAVGSDVVSQLRLTYSELLDTVPANYRIQDIEGSTVSWCTMRTGGPSTLLRVLT